MHACWEGVVKQFLSYWLEPENSNEPFYVKDKSAFEQQLQKIKFPHDFSHPVRSYATFGAYWKGKICDNLETNRLTAVEFKNFALFIFPSIMHHFLQRKYFRHFLLFVDAMVIITARSIPMEDVTTARRKLLQFVKETEPLYGKVSCGYHIPMTHWLR
jgi:hypothetical protein